MSSQENNYRYYSKKDYSSINKSIVYEEKEKRQSKQNSIFYTVELKYYYYENNYDYEDDYYDENDIGVYYIVIPKEYLENKQNLIKDKNDIFSKGKILTLYPLPNHDDFKFDVVVESSEKDPKNENIEYAYLVPIKKKYKEYNEKLLGTYQIEERSGDLTYERMLDAINEFTKGNCCSKNLENYILGNNINNIYQKRPNLFNYNINYLANIYNYAKFTRNQEEKIENIFYQEMSTINISGKQSNEIICLIIYAIYQCRKNKRDKILVCSSSNSVADSIALDMLRMRFYINDFNILRIYAKNQEIINRNKRLNRISFHKLIKRRYKKNFYNKQQKKQWILKNKDIIISTCVNSYNDDIINLSFPFVVIIDANNSNENENLIPITLNAKHALLISYEGSDNKKVNLYKRIKYLYPQNHYEI